MTENIVCSLAVNGFPVEAEYAKQDVEEIFIPLIKRFSTIQYKEQKRIIVYLAAPPGLGKSTLSIFLEKLSETSDDFVPIQAVGLDGFHYPNNYLECNRIHVNGISVLMKDVKGCPETFDIDKLLASIKQLKQGKAVKWPVYDRTLHDISSETITVSREIIVIEGNWLLLNEPGWKELSEYCDYSVFMNGDKNMLKERLVMRKQKGGLTKEEALEFYEKSDSHNVMRTVKHRLISDVELVLLPSGRFVLGGNGK